MEKGRTFTAAVKIAGINPYVDVPLPVARILGSTSKVRVLVKVSPLDSLKKASRLPAKGSLTSDAERLEVIGRLGPGGWFRTG